MSEKPNLQLGQGVKVPLPCPAVAGQQDSEPTWLPNPIEYAHGIPTKYLPAIALFGKPAINVRRMLPKRQKLSNSSRALLPGSLRTAKTRFPQPATSVHANSIKAPVTPALSFPLNGSAPILSSASPVSEPHLATATTVPVGTQQLSQASGIAADLPDVYRSHPPHFEAHSPTQTPLSQIADHIFATIPKPVQGALRQIQQ